MAEISAEASGAAAHAPSAQRARRVHRCLVCGDAIPHGEGVTTRYRGQILHFRCHTCWNRFEQDPERYLSGRTRGCCDTHEPTPSPTSEWTCD